METTLQKDEKFGGKTQKFVHKLYKQQIELQKILEYARVVALSTDFEMHSQ